MLSSGVKQVEFEVHLYEASNKVIIGGDGGWGSCCFPCIIEERGEYDCDSLEEMLTAALAMGHIVAEDVIAIDIYIKFVALFPLFLNQPRADIVLAHVVDQVFKLREIWWFINKDIAIWVPWATLEALGILSIDGGKIVFLFVIIIVVAHKFMGL